MNAATIEHRIHSYIAAWNARDYGAMASHFTEPAVFVLPTMTRVLPTRADFIGFLHEIFAALEARSYGHTVIGTITSRELAPGLYLAEVDDIRRYHRDGHLLETIEVQYTLRAGADGGLAIVSALWCDMGWRGRLLANS